MFYKADCENYIDVLDGIQRKTLTYGENTLLTEFRLQAGNDLPYHTHPHEQIGYLVSGCIILTIDGEEMEIRPGDGWCVPGNTDHGARIIEDSVAVEVFSPVRKEYLPSLQL